MPLEQAPTVLPGRLPPAKPVPGEAEEVPPPSHKRALMMDQELASVAQLHRQVLSRSPDRCGGDRARCEAEGRAQVTRGQRGRRQGSPERSRPREPELPSDEHLDHFPMPLTKSTIETSLNCTVRGRPESATTALSTVSGMTVLKEKWAKPPPLRMADAIHEGASNYQDYSPRSLQEIGTTPRIERLRSVSFDADSYSRLSRTMRTSGEDMQAGSARVQVLQKELEMQMQRSNALMSRFAALQNLEGFVYTVPPEMGPPIGDHMRANNDALWREQERKRREEIARDEQQRNMPPLQRMKLAEKERKERKAAQDRQRQGTKDSVLTRGPQYASHGAVSALQSNAHGAEDAKGLKCSPVPNWRKVNWWNVKSRNDTVRPFDAEDYEGGYVIARYHKFRRTSSDVDTRCTLRRTCACCLFLVLCGVFIALFVFILQSSSS